MRHSDGQQNCFAMYLDYCADTSSNVKGLWEGKQDNECGLVIRDLKGKGNILGCCSPPQAMCIPAVSVRLWAAEGLLWQGCFPLSLYLSSWNTSHAPFYLLSFHVVDSYISTCRIISASVGWQRLSPRPMSCTLPGTSRLHVCVLQCCGKHKLPSQVFQKKKQIPVCGYQHMQISWNIN